MNVERERILGSDRAPGVQRRGASGITLALVVVAAGCGGNDGSVGFGSGQDPDPVAIDFPIAYTKGPLFDAQMQLLSSSKRRTVFKRDRIEARIGRGRLGSSSSIARLDIGIHGDQCGF